MPSEFALQKAAGAWGTPATRRTRFDSDLAEAFAEILDEIWSQPWLGNATTAELLAELTARAEVGGYANYKTTGDNEIESKTKVVEPRLDVATAHELIRELFSRTFDEEKSTASANKEFDQKKFHEDVCATYKGRGAPAHIMGKLKAANPLDSIAINSKTLKYVLEGKFPTDDSKRKK